MTLVICLKRGTNSFLVLSDGNPTPPNWKPYFQAWFFFSFFFFQLSSFSLVASAIHAKKSIPIFMVEYNAYICSELADTSTLLGSHHVLTCQLPLYYPTQRVQVEKKKKKSVYKGFASIKPLMHNNTSLCKAMTSPCCISLLFDFMVSEASLVDM